MCGGVLKNSTRFAQPLAGASDLPRAALCVAFKRGSVAEPAYLQSTKLLVHFAARRGAATGSARGGGNVSAPARRVDGSR
jgi:hypothetical protein